MSRGQRAQESTGSVVAQRHDFDEGQNFVCDNEPLNIVMSIMPADEAQGICLAGKATERSAWIIAVS